MDKSQNNLSEKLGQAKILIKVGELYRHYKDPGKIYKVIDIGLFEPTQEIYVIYQPQYGEKLLWIRTLENFTDYVEVNGRKLPRFEKI